MPPTMRGVHLISGAPTPRRAPAFGMRNIQAGARVLMFLALTSFGRAGDKPRVGAESGLSPTNKLSLPSSERAESTSDDTVTRADKNSLIDSPSAKVSDVVRGAPGSPMVTGRPKIAVRVYAYPQVSSSIVARAEREVTAILREAKVETDWLNYVADSEQPCTCSRCCWTANSRNLDASQYSRHW